MIFEVGQKVQCINRKIWDDQDGEVMDGPDYGAICTVAGTFVEEGFDYLLLEEFSIWDLYRAKYFRPFRDEPEAVQRTVEKHFPIQKYLKEPEAA